MKKIYNTPTLTAVNVSAGDILAGSDTAKMFQENATGAAMSRGRGASYEDEDEEDWDF